jgi:hypothetical protein
LVEEEGATKNLTAFFQTDQSQHSLFRIDVHPLFRAKDTIRICSHTNAFREGESDNFSQSAGMAERLMRGP